MTQTLQTAHFLCAAYMTGVIWLVQRVQYPMLHLLDGAEAEAGHAEYTHRMGPVVLPVMLMEAGLQLYWVSLSPGTLSFLCAFLLGLIWLSTFLLQVPFHSGLQKRFDPALQKKLVGTNWIRTFCWTLRALLLGFVLNT